MTPVTLSDRSYKDKGVGCITWTRSYSRIRIDVRENKKLIGMKRLIWTKIEGRF